jgi:glutathione S-transferase
MKLYWAPRTRSLRALWVLEEAGVPYERVKLDLTAGDQKSPEFRAVNPMAKVPALTDGPVSVAESGAICAYVAEAAPQAGLAPPLGDPGAAVICNGCFSRRVVSSPLFSLNPPISRCGPRWRVLEISTGFLTCSKQRSQRAPGCSASVSRRPM